MRQALGSGPAHRNPPQIRNQSATATRPTGNHARFLELAGARSAHELARFHGASVTAFRLAHPLPGSDDGKTSE
jgi:hypothetical protein